MVREGITTVGVSKPGSDVLLTNKIKINKCPLSTVPHHDTMCEPALRHYARSYALLGASLPREEARGGGRRTGKEDGGREEQRRREKDGRGRVREVLRGRELKY